MLQLHLLGDQQYVVDWMQSWMEDPIISSCQYFGQGFASCSKKDGIELSGITIVCWDGRFRVRILHNTMTELDELVLESDKVWFEFR